MKAIAWAGLALSIIVGCSSTQRSFGSDSGEAAGKSDPSAGSNFGGNAGTGGSPASGGKETAEAGTEDVGDNSAGMGGGGGAVTACGNGRLEDAERCDDGNTESGDGCSSVCKVELGWGCTQSEPSSCEPICSDGLVLGSEANAGGCDDKNKLDQDGCSSSCEVEPGYVCSGTPSTCAKTCGNGKLDAAEGCDDGNSITGDGCTACSVENGYACDNATLPSQCRDVNECTLGASPCDAHATCTNAPGSYSCKCSSGYAGSGKTCADIDECTTVKPCSANATCTNNAGSFVCSCKSGYVGNGLTCARPSCSDLVGTECQGGDCCASPTVAGGTFKLGGAAGTLSATLTAFALDKFEVTVGRFRKFQSLYVGHPVNGAGAHPSIAGSGWQSPAWDSAIAVDASALAAAVQCDAGYQTWNPSGVNDKLPMNCVDWYEAFAFCAWDGGRLPTEVEWEYASAGGSEQRVYPWGNTPVPTNAQDGTAAYANYDGLGDGSAPGVKAFADILAVGSKPSGIGKYGQLDLAGSMWEWGLDWLGATYASPCSNCANLTVPADPRRVARGGNWSLAGTALATANRASNAPDSRSNTFGFRCARDL